MQIQINIHIHIHIQSLFCIPVTAVCKWLVRIYMFGSKFAPVPAVGAPATCDVASQPVV